MTWTFSEHTDVGRQRTRNEDACLVVHHGADDYSFIVCDGMGGHEDGHVASAVGVATLGAWLQAHAQDPEVFRVLHEALRAADQAVTAEANGRTMGSTAVVARVIGPRCWYGWVGDSRLYLYRGGALIERSEDHTRVAAMVAAGQLSASEARHHPDAHLLTQALGTGVAQPTVYADPIELQPGDMLVLCSDGLHDLVEPEELPDLMAAVPLASAAQELVAVANERGGHDNITVVAARWSADRPLERPTVQEEPPASQMPARPEPVRPTPADTPPPSAAARFLPLVLAAVAGAVVGSAATAWWLSPADPPAEAP